MSLKRYSGAYLEAMRNHRKDFRPCFKRPRSPWSVLTSPCLCFKMIALSTLWKKDRKGAKEMECLIRESITLFQA